MRKRRGFTLMEMILVVAIILIVSALAAPLIFEGLYSETRVVSAADAVRAAWADCRAWAVEEDRPYQFSVLPNSGKFKVEPYHPDGDIDPNAPGHQIENSLPEGIRFGTIDHPADPDGIEPENGEYIVVAVFLPNGTAREDVDVMFAAKNSSIVTLRLHGFSGTATTIRPGQEGK